MDDLIRRVEMASQRALPSLEETYIDGWFLRAAEGHTRRANSVQPNAYTGNNLDDSVANAVAWYHDRDISPIFRLTPLSKPGNLDDYLVEEGWDLGGPVSVQAADLRARHWREGGDVEFADAPNREWFETLLAGNPEMVPRRRTLEKMLSTISPVPLFALLRVDANPVACGLAVVDGSEVGLFNIATIPVARRQGYGRAVTETLLARAVTLGAGTAYLQVLGTNRPAVDLYGSMGFGHVYDYWYRSLP